MTIQEKARQAAEKVHPWPASGTKLRDEVADAAAVAVLRAERERIYRKLRLFEPNEGAYNALAQLLEESDAMLAAFAPAPVAPPAQEPLCRCGHAKVHHIPECQCGCSGYAPAQEPETPRMERCQSCDGMGADVDAEQIQTGAHSSSWVGSITKCVSCDGTGWVEPEPPAAPSPSDVEQAKRKVMELFLDAENVLSADMEDAVDALIAAVHQEQAAEIEKLKAGEATWRTIANDRAARIARDFTICAELKTRAERAEAEVEKLKADLAYYQGVSTALSVPPSDVLGRPEIVQAMVKIRAHTSYANTSTELLTGLLQSIERIADEALQHAARPAQETKGQA